MLSRVKYERTQHSSPQIPKNGCQSRPPEHDGLEPCCASGEDGTFVRPSEANSCPFETKQIPRLDLRGLCNEFLTEKRKLRGKKTARTYKDRLSPILDFAELKSSTQQWPLAASIDRGFVVEGRNFLMNRLVARNGKPGAKKKPMSVRQVINCLETLRTMLAWGCRADVRKLPLDFTNPVSRDLIGVPPCKDPLRKAKLPIERRMELIESMDDWQFLHLVTLFVLPLRFEDISGALISDVSFDEQTMRLCSRFGGSDFNKGRVSVEMPIPAELAGVFQLCIGHRTEGPLFQSRAVWQGRRARVTGLSTHEELEVAFHNELASKDHGEIQAEQDRKRVFRQPLAETGRALRQLCGKAITATHRERPLHSPIRPTWFGN